MAVNKRLKRAYGFGQGIYDLSPQPIAAQRAPTTKDMAEIGTIWCDQKNNAVYTLASVVANSANWQAGGGGGASFKTLTVNTGPTILNGAVTVNAAGNPINIATDGSTSTTTIGNNQPTTSVVVDTGAGGNAQFGANATQHNTTVGSTTGTSTTTLQSGTGGTNVTSTGISTISSSAAANQGAVTLQATGNNSGVVLEALATMSTGITLFTAATAGVIIGDQQTPAAGIYVGVGVPAFQAGQGSLYINTGGNSTSTRLYVNSSVTSGTTWTNFVSAS